jgi:hypothetical protein
MAELYKKRLGALIKWKTKKEKSLFMERKLNIR